MRHRQPRKGPEKRTGNQNPKAISPRYRAMSSHRAWRASAAWSSRPRTSIRGHRMTRDSSQGRIPVGRPQARKADAAR